MRFLYIFVTFFYGCITFPTSQTPQVVVKGRGGFGLSVSSSWLIESDGAKFLPISYPSYQIRYGIGNKSELGLLVFGFPILGLTYIDYKRQFLNSNILGAFTIGTGFWLGGTFSPFFGVSFGNEVLYAGSRIQYYYLSYQELEFDLFNSSKPSTITFSGTLITSFIGLTIGEGNLKFAPELNIGIPINPVYTGIEIPNYPPYYPPQIKLLPTPFFTYSIGFIYLPTEKKK